MIDERKLLNWLLNYQFENYAEVGHEREYIFIENLIKGIENEPKVGEWIPCSERPPEDCDNRFYMCVVENHEEDPPMYCQYEEGIGFGFWNDVFDEHTLGFVDSYFRTNEELGYETVIAWMPLPEPYKENENE